MASIHGAKNETSSPLSEGEFSLGSLVDKWEEEVLEVFDRRMCLEKDDVPPDLHQIVSLWNKEGPNCISTVSHPSRMSLINMVGRLRFALFRERVEEFSDFSFRFPALDTIDVETNGVIRPFWVANILRLNEKAVPNSLLELSEWSTIENLEAFAVALLESLSVEVDQLIDTQSNPRNRGRFMKKRIRRGVVERLDLLSKFVSDSSDPNQNKHLNNLQNQITSRLFPEINAVTGPLNSEDIEWLNLIRRTSLLLHQVRGDQLFIDFCPDWKVIALSESNSRFGLTKVNNCMAIINTQTFEIIDHEVNLPKFLESAVPLAGMELLCQTAGLRTMQFGSEHGWRSFAIQALGLTGKAADVACRLAIGEDGEHVNKVIKIEGFPNLHVPIALLFVTMSELHLRQLILMGSDCPSAFEFTPNEFRQFLANALVESSLEN